MGLGGYFASYVTHHHPSTMAYCLGPQGMGGEETITKKESDTGIE